MREFLVCRGFEDKDISLPKRSTAYSAGYDFESCEDVDIKPNDIVLVKTGVKAIFAKDEVLKIYARSSLAIKYKLMLSNSVGIIDSDYANNPKNDGHIMIPLFNMSNKTVHISKHERVAQGIFEKYLLVDSDCTTSKREGGFGSTN